MDHCDWCGESLIEDDDGTEVCRYGCDEECELCGGVVGDCHEDGRCVLA